MSALVSLLVVGAVVGLCELCRGAMSQLSSGVSPGVSPVYQEALWELVCTLQLCWCALEMQLLGASSELQLCASVSLLYGLTLLHLRSFRGASCSVLGPLERLWRGALRPPQALVLVGAQVSGAVLAQVLSVQLWSQGWSQVHVRHQRSGFQCSSAVRGSVLQAAATELFCCACIQVLVLQLHRLPPALRLHALSAGITAMVLTGGAVSGAVMNPVLALALQFPCSGLSYLDFLLVYCLGPVLGVLSANLLLPSLCGRSPVTMETQKKTQ
ncbi:unnamed protein product [Knipowitschia caucasica]|uniref:Aquaporin n=1 Tax=Knipowitschia caucasica TaxID=637954 RepID=A0AAV2J7M3_KNICA